MITVAHAARPTRVLVVSVALSITFGPVSTSSQHLAVQTENASSGYSPKQMADGKRWTTQNLDINIAQSYCYGDAELNCRHYGRLYTWESAQRSCRVLGDQWRLPTDDDWRQMAKHYGGISADSEDKGKAAYKQLLVEGNSGFNASLGGGRDKDGLYSRLEAHGFYWTASESDPSTAVFYNFGRGGQALHRQSGSEKQRAFSVRCITE